MVGFSPDPLHCLACSYTSLWGYLHTCVCVYGSHLPIFANLMAQSPCLSPRSFPCVAVVPPTYFLAGVTFTSLSSPAPSSSSCQPQLPLTASLAAPGFWRGLYLLGQAFCPTDPVLWLFMKRKERNPIYYLCQSSALKQKSDHICIKSPTVFWEHINNIKPYFFLWPVGLSDRVPGA